MEFSMELSSEVPGTSADWPSDITVCGQRQGHRHLDVARRFRRQARRLYARLVEAQGQPVWQAQELAGQRATGTYVDGMKISPVSLKDLDLDTHHSIRLRIGVKADAKHPGGINIFGRGFGNYDQDIVLRLQTERRVASQRFCRQLCLRLTPRRPRSFIHAQLI